jgi:thioredoxin 1
LFRWCGPCKILGPKLEKIIDTQFSKTAKMAKVDIDDNSDLAMEHGVSSVPTVIAFKNGKKIGMFIGLIDDDKIVSFIKDATENNNK